MQIKRVKLSRRIACALCAVLLGIMSVFVAMPRIARAKADDSATEISYVSSRVVTLGTYVARDLLYDYNGGIYLDPEVVKASTLATFTNLVRFKYSESSFKLYRYPDYPNSDDPETFDFTWVCGANQGDSFPPYGFFYQSVFYKDDGTALNATLDSDQYLKIDWSTWSVGQSLRFYYEFDRDGNGVYRVYFTIKKPSFADGVQDVNFILHQCDQMYDTIYYDKYGYYFSDPRVDAAATEFFSFTNYFYAPAGVAYRPFETYRVIALQPVDGNGGGGGTVDPPENPDINEYFQSGYNYGYDEGFTDGTNGGYQQGLQAGQNAGYNDGYMQGHQIGKTEGYNQGYTAGMDGQKYTFMSLISAVVDAPIQAFTGLTNFTVLGINMKDFYLSLLTFCVIIFIVKLLI